MCAPDEVFDASSAAIAPGVSVSIDGHPLPEAPSCTSWRHDGVSVSDVPSVQIKSVPEDVHAELRRRAATEGKSLQEYLLGRLVEEARRPSLDNLLARAGQRSGGHVSFRFASEAVRKDRDAG